jgi:hypothetical protein
MLAARGISVTYETNRQWGLKFGREFAKMRFFQIAAEREQTVTRSFPANDDYDGLRKMITDSVEGDTLGVGARVDGDTMVFAYPSVILLSVKPSPVS